MKVNRRSVPMDMLSMEDKHYRAVVHPHGANSVWLRIEKDGQLAHSQELTFHQFVSLLMRDAQP